MKKRRMFRFFLWSKLSLWYRTSALFSVRKCEVKWRFPEMGVPPVIIQTLMAFSLKKGTIQRAWGTLPPLMEPPSSEFRSPQGFGTNSRFCSSEATAQTHLPFAGSRPQRTTCGCDSLVYTAHECQKWCQPRIKLWFIDKGGTKQIVIHLIKWQGTLQLPSCLGFINPGLTLVLSIIDQYRL